jgi:hypothetical protein
MRFRRHALVERSIAWLVRGNRRVPYRGVTKNNAWLHHRLAGLNLRRLLALGLNLNNGAWQVAQQPPAPLLTRQRDRLTMDPTGRETRCRASSADSPHAADRPEEPVPVTTTCAR